MKSNNDIHIVVASDNHYAILIAALLKSIDLHHTSGEHINFYIIDDNISANFHQKLESIADPARITLKWIKSKDTIPEGIVIPVDKSSFPLTAYLRVFSPYVVDADLEKLIYLDVDTIVRDDISKLWNIDLGEYKIAAAQDVGKTVDCEWGGIPNYKELGLAADTKYFNSGVILLNPKRWREERVADQVITTLIEHREHVRLADQYALNVVMANNWMQLDPKWNWFAFKEEEGASIIHFLDIKPIFKSYNSQPAYQEEFFKYLNMTPWKNFKPISGRWRVVRKIYNKLKKAYMRVAVSR